MARIISIVTRTRFCDTAPQSSPVVTRDANDRITSVEDTRLSIKKTVTAAYDDDNLMVDGSFSVTMEDVI